MGGPHQVAVPLSRLPGIVQLGGISLLQLLLVLLHLVLMLGPQFLQGIRQPALKLTLLPIVNLHQPCLMTALGLTQLLTVDILLEVQFLLHGLQPVLSIHPPQHLILKLLLGLTQGCLKLGHLAPKIMQLALQRALLTESSAQCGLLGIEQSLRSFSRA